MPYKVDFKSLSWAVWSLGCHNDSLVLLVFFEDIHIRTGSLSVFWVTWSSSWHPKETLDLTHIMLSSGVPVRVTTRAVFGLADRSLAWHRSARRFHQCWILMNGSNMISGYSEDDLRADEKVHRKTFSWFDSETKKKRRSCNAQITTLRSLKVHPSNPVNSTTAAAVTIIS